jgi:ABC-type nitrate/sulfonate/bicarbonate transport system permease component
VTLGLEPKRRRWVSVLAVVLFFLAWQLICTLVLVSPVLLASPSQIAVTGWRLIIAGDLNTDTLFTLSVFVTGLGLAVLFGVAVGLLIGFSDLAFDALQPFIVTASALPKIVLMPLVVLWFGIGMSGNVFLSMMMGAFPIIMSIHAGIKSLDQDLLLLARAYGASRWLTFRSIVLPGLTPFLLGGLRVAVSYTMVGALIAEFFASSEGLGYRMVLTMSNFHVAEFFVCIVLVAFLTLAFQSIVHWLERKVEGWRPPMNALDPGAGL